MQNDNIGLLILFAVTNAKLAVISSSKVDFISPIGIVSFIEKSYPLINHVKNSNQMFYQKNDFQN